MIPRRVTEDIITNVEIVPRTGGKCRVAWGGGVPPSPKKYRPVAKAASHLLPQYAYLAREGGFLLVGVKRTIKDSGIFSKRLKAAFTTHVDTR